MRVCILGAGIASLALAKALVNQNIYTDIITDKKLCFPDQSRTIGISKSNVDFFNNSIINIDKISWKLKKIEIFSDNLKKEKLLNFESNDNELFSIIKNAELFNVLVKSLDKNKYFKLVRTFNKIEVLKNYNLIINTDYLNLFTKKYFSKKIIKKYNSLAYTTIINHQKISNNIAVQIFTKKGPLAFLPISNNKTSIVYSIYNSSFENNENLKDLIIKYGNKYKIKKIDKIKSYKLKSLSLRSYYHKNIIAFGNILHTIHPLAGQGFNMTLRDIKTFLEIVISKNSLGLPIDSSVGQEFEKKLKHKNLIFSSGIDFIHEFFNLERKINSPVISKSLQIIGENAKLKKFFIKIADHGILL